jgi:hypothetical protein
MAWPCRHCFAPIDQEGNAAKGSGFPEGEFILREGSGPTHLSAGMRCIGPTEPGSTSAAGSLMQGSSHFGVLEGTPWLAVAVQGFAIDQTPSAIGSLVAIMSRPCEIWARVASGSGDVCFLSQSSAPAQAPGALTAS